MDYSEMVEKSRESDLIYAKWYAEQPDERKAAMILSGYKMVAQNIRNQVLHENPYATEADILLKFVEITQKSDYPPETYAFIEKQFQEKAAKEWQTRFKKMKKELGWNYEQMAKFIGAANGNSLKASVNRQLPAFAKLAVCVFENQQISS